MLPATLAIAGSYALLANAQVDQTTASGTESLTPFQSTQATCLEQCHVADVGCRTDCINVHNPSGDPILAIQKCQAGCVQGDGSVEQTSSYGMCLQNCIDLGNVVSTVGGGAAPAAEAGSSTSGSAMATTTGSASSATELATTIGTSTVSGTTAGASASAASASSAAASATVTGNAAYAVRVGTASLGLFGLLAAFIM